MGLRAELVTSPARFAEIGPAWDDLWQRAGASSFQSYGWMRAWWDSRPPRNPGGWRLRIALCWEGDVLVAVIPGATRLHRGLRVLEWAAKECSDYCDALVCPQTAAALPCAWQALVAAGGFHAIHLNHVRPGATFQKLFDAALPRASILRRGSQSEQTLQVQSRGLGSAAWFATLSKKARNNHRRCTRILEESGPLVVGAVDGPAADAAMNQMITLKQSWLVATRQHSPLLTDGPAALLRLAGHLRHRRALQVYTLTCGTELIAGLVNIVGDGVSSPFFSAFDPHYDRGSPGAVILVEHIKWAFDHGIPTVDFLCGEEAYKRTFSNAQTELVTYIGGRTLLGKIAVAISERRNRANPSEPSHAR